MAKRNKLPSTKNRPKKIVELTTDELMANALPEKDGLQTQLANHVQFNINQNEIYIDFYRFEPPYAPNGEPKSFHVQRIAIPNAMGKGFAVGMANLVANFEKITGTELPLQRERKPEDEITIW